MARTLEWSSIKIFGWVGSSLPLKYQTWVELIDIEKYLSLPLYQINYQFKSFKIQEAPCFGWCFVPSISSSFKLQCQNLGKYFIAQTPRSPEPTWSPGPTLTYTYQVLHSRVGPWPYPHTLKQVCQGQTLQLLTKIRKLQS